MTDSSAEPEGTDSTDLALDFVLINEFLDEGGGREPALQRLAQLAVRAVPGCAWAAITAWPEGGRPHSLAGSGEVSDAADQLQYDLGEGPCMTAAAGTEAVRSIDLDAEQRWPKFVQAVREQTAVRGVLSFHLADQPIRAALNLYSDEPAAFDDRATSIAALFAAHARVLLLHAGSSEKAANLASALSTSRQIGTAMGILMNVHKVTADEAFNLLRVSSQHLNRKLHQIAEDVALTGTLPTERV